MDYYCATKFTDLMVHVQARLLYNCCKAYPERINLQWLEKNPGSLFHTDTMIDDRKKMLDNKSCFSCHHGCYKQEEQGIMSARQHSVNPVMDRSKSKLQDPYASLKDLTIALTTDCNLACVYCAPEWSTTWQREVDQGGSYVMEDYAIKNSNFNKTWSKLKQKARGADNKFFKLLLNEIKLADELEVITLLGGEPLLNNQFDHLLESAIGKRIKIFSGLGVSDQRLQKVLDKTKGMPISWNISAEATGRHFEFVRHGLTWDEFVKKVDMINDNGQEIVFHSTISNLSAFDFSNFYKHFGTDFPIKSSSVTGRPFMSPHVLDKESKDQIVDSLESISSRQNKVAKWLYAEPSDLERRNIGSYLRQLRKRRSVDLHIFPKNFLQWCGADKPN